MKNYLVMAIIALVVFLAGFAFLRVIYASGGAADEAAFAEGIFGAQSVNVTDGNCFISPTGTHVCPIATPLTATSSVPASIACPSATSTIVRVVVNVSSLGNMKTTDLFEISTSTSNIGSSTPALMSMPNLVSALGRPYIWTPTQSSTTVSNLNKVLVSAPYGDGTMNNYCKPGEKITMRYATTTPGTFLTYLTGTMIATFEY